MYIRLGNNKWETRASSYTQISKQSLVATGSVIDMLEKFSIYLINVVKKFGHTVEALSAYKHKLRQIPTI